MHFLIGLSARARVKSGNEATAFNGSAINETSTVPAVSSLNGSAINETSTVPAGSSLNGSASEVRGSS